jgi:hypothetical protein
VRFLLMHRVSEDDPQAWTPSKEFAGRMNEFIQEWLDRGILITAEGVHPSSAGALVRKSASEKVRVTDGPFTEAKEVIGGFGLIHAENRAQAVEYAREYIAIFEDIEIEVEVRQVVEYDELPA